MNKTYLQNPTKRIFCFCFVFVFCFEFCKPFVSSFAPKLFAHLFFLDLLVEFEVSLSWREVSSSFFVLGLDGDFVLNEDELEELDEVIFFGGGGGGSITGTVLVNPPGRLSSVSESFAFGGFGGGNEKGFSSFF